MKLPDRHLLLRPLSAACVSLLGVAATTPVFAQESGRKQDEDTRLEEVIVTAERVEKDLQTTPVSVLQVTGEEMHAKGAENIAELSSFLPNVSIGPSTQGGGGGQPQFTIRGVSQIRTGISGDRSVGFYIDDQFFSRTTGSTMRALDIANVEILRGPQGTLFGRNNTGGAIKFTNNKPADEFGGNLRLGLGDYDRRDVAGILNVPLIPEKVLFRGSLARYERDGYVEGQNGQSKGNVDETNARAALRFKFTEDFIADVAFTSSKSDEAGFASNLVGEVNPNELAVLACQVRGACPRTVPFVTIPGSNHWVGVPVTPDPAYTPALKVTGDPFKYVGGDQEFDRTDQKILNGTLNWRINDNFSMRSITASLKIDNERFNDSDQTALPIGTSNGRTEHESWSQELHFIFKNLFNDRVDAITGLFYFDEDNSSVFTNSGYDGLSKGGQSPWSLIQDNRGQVSATFPLRFGQTFPYTIPGPFGFPLGVCPSFFPFTGTAQNPVPAAGATQLMGCIDTDNLGINSTTQSASSTAESWAAFADTTIRWTDKLSMSAGLRYTKDEKSWFLDNQVTAYGTVIGKKGGTWDAVDWRFVTQFQMTPDAMVYGSVSKAYKSGGFTDGVAFGFGGFGGFGENEVGVETRNPITGEVIDSPFIPYDPEKVISYELGFRTEWFDNRFRANVTLFKMDYTDKHTTVLILPGQTGGNTQFANSFGGGAVIINAAEVAIDGVETEFDVAVTQSLTLSAMAAYLDARYEEIDDLVGSITEDTPLERAPEYSFTVGARYDHQVFSGMGSAQINYAYTAEQWSGADENIQWRIPPLGLVNTRLGYFSGGGRWSVGLSVNNLLDEEYLYGGISFSSFAGGVRSFTGSGTNMIFPARPREIGVDFTYNFGALPRFGRR